MSTYREIIIGSDPFCYLGGMTGLSVWTNRLYWVVCGGLILTTAGLAAERHLRRLASDQISPALAQTSEEISGERRELDELREQVAKLAAALSSLPASRQATETPTSSPVTKTVKEAAAKPATTGGVAPAAASAIEEPKGVAAASLGPININTASKEVLMTLPGIGPSYAEKILAGRPFSSIDELAKVKGIGPKTMEKLRPLVSI